MLCCMSKPMLAFMGFLVNRGFAVQVALSLAAPDPDTAMLECRHTSFCTPHLFVTMNTIWSKGVDLGLIRPKDMVPVIPVFRMLRKTICRLLFYTSPLNKAIIAMQKNLMQCVSTDRLAPDIFYFCSNAGNAGGTHNIFLKDLPLDMMKRCHDIFPKMWEVYSFFNNTGYGLAQEWLGNSGLKDRWIGGWIAEWIWMDACVIRWMDEERDGVRWMDESE